MLKFLILSFIVLLSISSKSQMKLSDIEQIQNGGFEIDSNSFSLLPKNWVVKAVNKCSLKLDKKEFNSGTASFKIVRDSVIKDGKSDYFQQSIPLQVDELSRISIVGFIKTKDVEGAAGIYCQILDGNGKQIWYSNLEMQNITVDGNSEWTKYKLSLVVDKDSKTLLLGGYLSGNGCAWYDDFSIEKNFDNLTPPSHEVQTYVTDFISIVKYNSLFSEKLKWKEILDDTKLLCKGLTTTLEAQLVIDYIIRKLRSVGDNHTFLQAPITAKKYRNGGEIHFPSSRLLTDNIGYINVPRFSKVGHLAEKEFATDIQNFIKQLDRKNDIKGWIIDLRNNTGGNMYPMIAGLGPLTGNGKLGYFIRTERQKVHKTPWFYSNGSAGLGKRVIVKVDTPYRVENKGIKVVILIGPRTSSSGEMTAMSFIGQRNTALIGSATGGFTTANSAFRLVDGAYLYLATTYTEDRTGRKYVDKIYPDISTENLEKSEDDDIKSAIEWILK